MRPKQENKFNQLLGRLTPKTVAIVVFFSLITVYAFYQTHALAEGPQIILETPLANNSVSDPLIVIKGRAERISHLFLNGGRIFTNKDGYFTEKLLLAPGYNLIQLIATDKFGREIARDMELIYEPTQ